MKKYILLIILSFVYIISSYYIDLLNKDINRKNKKLYEEFSGYQALNVDGEVNLTSIKSINKELEEEINELFKQNVYNKEIYIKQLVEKEENNNLKKGHLEQLSLNITDLEGKKGELLTQYNNLKNKYDILYAKKIAMNNANNSYKFPLINQYPKYPTGCESVALTMLLKYYGVNVSPDDVIGRLHKESLPYYENGVKYGGNPEVGFIGNPYSGSSYGVYERPIANVANSYKSGINIKRDFPFSEVVNLVNSNTPVIVWVSMGLSVPYISDSWIYKDTMETIQWKASEHALVVVGVNGGNVVVADPIGGKIKNYSSSVFEARYNFFGRRALFY